VYLDPSKRVIKAVADLKPFRISGVLRGKCSVIELPRGAIAASNTSPGDQLAFDS
jgi:uncharacterized membrane protein (UPF0127 family)